MRFAFCLFKYFPYGGLERDFLRIAQAFVAAGHEVEVYTSCWEGPCPAGLKVQFFKLSAFTNAGKAKQFAAQLTLRLAQENYTAVLGFNRLPGLDFYFAADPCYQAQALRKHGAFYRWLPNFRKYVALEKAVFATTAKTKIFLLNSAHQAEFMQYYHTPLERFKLLFPGIGEDRRRPIDQAELRQRFRHAENIKAEQKILLMVGSDFHRKGVDRVLKALAELPSALKNKTQLWIVGRGNTTDFMKLAVRLKIVSLVRFWGACDQINEFYAAADALVHVAYEETAGMVLIEAIAAGLPVLVTANCGYASYIQAAAAGLVLPLPFSQTELNHALIKFLTATEQLAQYRTNALAYAKIHDLFQLPQQILKGMQNA